jgi:membrane-associated phospholipid phosphatase
MTGDPSRIRPGRPGLLALLLSLEVAAAGCAQQPPGETRPPVAAPPAMGGAKHQRLPAGTYISGATLPDTALVLPPPPLPGSPEQAADEAVFRQARALQGTPRWTLAQNDARLATTDVLADFSCALGFRVDPGRTPVLVSLLGHAGADMGPEIDRTKDLWGRRRPYLGTDLPICVPRGGSLDSSPSYPSGHATLGYGVALILAELVPDRSAAILQRGRVLSESRIVCGVHWLSDVQGGLVEGSALVAALHGSARFRADMDRARLELAALRHPASPAPDPDMCRIEADAAAHSLLFRAQPASR